MQIMRIAQVAPLFEAVPPRRYGGTERIIAYLTEELVGRGHDVTLFASADSSTSAQLIPQREVPLRLDEGLASPIAAHLSMLHEVRERARDFDVIHFHLSHFQHFPFFEHCPHKTVTTPHGRLDYRDLTATSALWPDFGLISISMRQRQPLPQARWLANIYHGLPLAQYPRLATDGGTGQEPYLAFLGRLSRDKRPDRAIEIARRAGMKLRIAAKVDVLDESYHREIRHLLDDPGVEFVGEVDEGGKAEFLANASALLFPIDWPEPFGLVLIEAMAFGLPVVAWNNGAVSEIVEDGKTGFVVRSTDEAVARLRDLARLDRHHIRSEFERRFSASRMADDYLALYASLIEADRTIMHRKGQVPGRRSKMTHGRMNGGRYTTGV